jgi:hypothetical protein
LPNTFRPDTACFSVERRTIFCAQLASEAGRVALSERGTSESDTQMAVHDLAIATRSASVSRDAAINAFTAYLQPKLSQLKNNPTLYGVFIFSERNDMARLVTIEETVTANKVRWYAGTTVPTYVFIGVHDAIDKYVAGHPNWEED